MDSHPASDRTHSMVVSSMAEDALRRESIPAWDVDVFRFLVIPAFGDLTCWTLLRNQSETRFLAHCSWWNPASPKNTEDGPFHFQREQFVVSKEVGRAALKTIRALRVPVVKADGPLGHDGNDYEFVVGGAEAVRFRWCKTVPAEWKELEELVTMVFGAFMGPEENAE